MRSSILLLLSSTLTLGLFACGDSTGSGGGGGTAATGGNGGTEQTGGMGGGAGGNPLVGAGGGGGDAPTCDLPVGTPGDHQNVAIDQVTVAAHDESDNAIKNYDLQFCGANGCLYATTSVIGQATFLNTLSSDTMDRPTVKPGNSLDYGKIGYRYNAGDLEPFPVYFPVMEDSSQAMTPGTSVSAGGVTLDLSDDVIVAVDELTYDTPPRQTFRAGSMPTDLVDTATGTTGEFAMVYSLGPVDTLFCVGTAQATFDNYAALDADADVEIWGQELTLDETFAGYGEWAKIADGKVSADGLTITTTGDGLPVLLSVAIKLK